MSNVIEHDTYMEFQLEDPNAVGAFTAGMKDKREWRRHPETAQLLDTLNQNVRSTRIFVTTPGGMSTRVR